MKRSKLILALLLCLLSTVSWAETVVTMPRVSTATIKYTYTLHCKATDHGGNYLGIVDGSFNGRCAEANACRFEFELKEKGQYYIKSVDLGYMNASDGRISFSETPSTYWTLSAADDGGTYLLANGQDKVYLNNNKTSDDGIKTYNGTGGCSHWVFTEYITWSKPIVDGATYAIVNVQPSNSATRYYYLNNSAGTLTAVNATDMNALSEWPTTAQFVAKALGNGKFAFRNKSNGLYLGYKTFTSAAEDWSSWTMHESSRSGFENTYWFGCDKRSSSDNSTGTLIIANGGNNTNAGTFDNCEAVEYSATTDYSNNYGFVLLAEPDVERIALVNEYKTWKATLYDDDNLKIGAPASSQLDFMDRAIEAEEEYDGTALRGIFNTIKTTKYLNLPTGYYHMKSMDAGRKPYLYNDYNYTDNEKHHTLQANEVRAKNNFIWYVENHGNSISIKNGDGQPLVQGVQSARYNGDVVERQTLTFGNFNETNYKDLGGGIYFTEALNASNGDPYYLPDQTRFVTTWTGHADARDNNWTFEPIENPSNIYNVVIEGAPEGEAYVTMTGGQYAFNGGFLYGADIAESQLTATAIAGYNHSIDIKDKTITVLYFDDSKSVVTYVYKKGETEWLREKHLVENGADYPDLRALPNGVKISTVPYGKVSSNATIEIECTVDDKYDIPFSSSYSDAKWLYATIHSGSKYFWSYDSSTKQVKTNVTAFSNAKDQNAYMWAIIGNPIAGYQIINKAAGADMILTSASPKDDGANGGNTFPVMTNKNDVPDNHNIRWNITTFDFGFNISREGESIKLNHRGNYLAYWTGNGDGSRIGFFPIEDAIVEQNPMEGGKTYQARNLMSGEIITDFTGKTISTGNVDGCYHLSSAASVTTTPAIFYASNSISATENPVQWSSLSAFAEWYIEEKQDEPESIFNFGEPTYETSISTGKYYRLYNLANAGKLMTDKYNTSGGLLGKAAYSDIESASQVWLLTYTAAEAGTEGKYTLRNLLTGRYIGDQPNSSNQFPTVAESSQAKEFVVQKATNDTITYFTFDRAKNGNGLHYAPHQSDNVVLWGVSIDASKWWLDEVTVTEEMRTACEAFYGKYAAKVETVNNAEEYYSSLAPFFADVACTQINPTYKDYTDEQLRTAMSALPTELQDMAVCVKNNQWDENATRNHYVKDFRIHDYDIYSDPGVWADKTKVGGFSSLFHPTGITCKAGELLYILVGDDVKDSDAVLEIGIAEATHNGPSQRVEVHAGLNIIMPNVDGEAFVIYRLTDSEKYLEDYPTIKVHFANGEASGCFDMHRGHTNNDWAYLCSNMFTNKYLHIMGEHTVFSVESDRVRGAENICGSLKIWDYIFMTEEKLIGHDGQWDDRYNPVIGARDQYSGNPNWGGTSANYSGIYKDGLLNYNSLLYGDRWVIYHEEAHGHQYPVNLASTTESSNNGFAQMVNHEFGLSSRRANGTKTLITFKNNGWGWVDILRGGEGISRTNGFEYHDACVWVLNHMFYQLYLYFHVAGHKPDFWPRLCDEMRSNGGLIKKSSPTDPTLYYDDYLKFALAAAKVSKTDLSEFFDSYGFFDYYEDVKVGNEFAGFKDREQDYASTGVRYVGDYGGYYMKMPMKSNQADVNRINAAIAEMKAYPNKAPNIMFIDDHIKDRVVADTAFAVTLDPSLAGQPVKFYDNSTGVQGDFGDMADFNGQNEANALDYSISGNTITVSGEGMVGVKIYDENGNLIRIYNTYTITLDPEKDADIATKLTDGTYTLVAALGDDTNLPLAKPSAQTVEMLVYNGNENNEQTYTVTGEKFENVPYSASVNKTDVPALKGNEMALFPEVEYIGHALTLPGQNAFYKNGGKMTAPVFKLTDKENFYLPTGYTYSTEGANYKRTNTTGYNTVCLPFNVKAENFITHNGCKVYIFNGVNNDKTSVSFREAPADEEIIAGMPVLVYSEGGADWVISNSDNVNVTGSTSESGNITGAFQKRTLGLGYYKLNSAGTKFVKTTASSTITPFRFYLDTNGEAPSSSFSLVLEDNGDLTDTESAIAEESMPRTIIVYDLQGNVVTTLKSSNGTLEELKAEGLDRGIYIVDKKKIQIP